MRLNRRNVWIKPLSYRIYVSRRAADSSYPVQNPKQEKAPRVHVLGTHCPVIWQSPEARWFLGSQSQPDHQKRVA
jgi:hypothetical protein